MDAYGTHNQSFMDARSGRGVHVRRNS